MKTLKDFSDFRKNKLKDIRLFEADQMLTKLLSTYIKYQKRKDFPIAADQAFKNEIRLWAEDMNIDQKCVDILYNNLKGFHK